MKNLLKVPLENLLRERDELRKYLILHTEEKETMVYAGMQVALQWCEFKLAFYYSLVGELKK